MRDLNVIDLIFLKKNLDSDSPNLVLICKEPNNKLIAKVYTLDLTNGPIWKKEINDNYAFLISG